MALVEGPLFSLEARGKIGDVMVHFPWKGRNVVRKWLKPTNPRDIDQKIIRQKLAAYGKCLAAMITPGAVLANGSQAVLAWKTVTPAAQIWNAYFTKKGMDRVKDDADFTLVLSDALFGTSIDVDIWRCCALELELATLESTADAFATDISPELQLYMAAFAAYDADISSDNIDCSTHPCNWVTADISLFASDFTVA